MQIFATAMATVIRKMPLQLHFLAFTIAMTTQKVQMQKFAFEGGYSILLPQTEKNGFLDPPKRV